MTIGENIRKFRKERKLTQKQLGDRCGIDEANIRKYENGKQNPKLETIQKIAEALNIPWEVLLSNTSPSEKGAMVKAGIKDMVDNFNIEVDEIKPNMETSIEVLEQRHKYITLYDQLNGVGQNKAVEQVELLTKIPEYRKKD